MKMMASRAVVALMLALMPVETVAQTAQPPASVTTGQPEKLASGVTFTVPAEWTVKKTGKVVELTPVENDLHLVLVDIGEAADAKAAVAAAWSAWNPSRSRPPKLVTPRP